MTRKQVRSLRRIVIAAAALALLLTLPLSGEWELLLAAATYLYIGYDILLAAGRGLLRGAVMDENFLMAVAGAGAFALGMYRPDGDYTEAIAVVLFYRVGELFQSCAVSRSCRSIAELMAIRPETVRVVAADGSLSTVPPETVPPGSIIEVRPGEKVPLDGEVTEGEAELDTSALTGESLPRCVAPGARVPGGVVNLNALLRLRTISAYGDSSVAKILALVEESAVRKSRVERFITRFAMVYTPLVCAGALLLAVVPPLVQWLSGAAVGWDIWAYRALLFLVISCPCALVISVPLAFFAAVGGASRAGVLIKGAGFVETLARAHTVVFDKTGTLTTGEFRVVGAEACGSYTCEQMVEYAALAEHAGAHPISRCLRAACPRPLDPARVSSITEQPGWGITAVADSHRVAVGSSRLMQSLGIAPQPLPAGSTAVHVGIDGAYAGYILIADTPRAEAPAALRGLAALGVRRTVMLTGDTAAAAAETAAQLGICEVHSGLLPAQKVEQLERLLPVPRGSLVYVGDGVNDAPVLTRADVGIAMGALGQQAAIEAADVVLMRDDPLLIPGAIRHSRRCMRIVQQSIALALGVKFTCLGLGALGMVGMWAAIFADVGVSVLAILNAMRAYSAAAFAPRSA